MDSIEKIEAPVQVVEPADTTKTVPEPVKEQQQTSEPEETTVKTTTTEETVIQAEHVKTSTAICATNTQISDRLRISQ